MQRTGEASSLSSGEASPVFYLARRRWAIRSKSRREKGFIEIIFTKGALPMSKNTRIYHRWNGYTAADCACQFCLWYPGKDRPCTLEVCCCEEEQAGEQGALSRVMPQNQAMLKKDSPSISCRG